MTTMTLLPRLLASAARSPIAPVYQVPKSSFGTALVITVAILGAAASAPTASAQTVTYTGAAVNFGTANICPAGKTVPAPCSQTLTLTYNVTASGTLGTPKALTTGAPDLDYKLASGSTCTGSVSKGNTCKVNVTFAPTQPGARNGAVEIVDTSGSVLATTYIYATGVGPRIGFNPAAAVRTIGGVDSVLAGPSGVNSIAVDGNGNIFVGVHGGFGGGNPLSYVAELLAVDGSMPANPVVKVLSTVVQDGNGIFPTVVAVAVDGAGNLFYSAVDFLTDGYLVEMLAADGYATSRTFNFGGDYIAIDGSGNLFLSYPPYQRNVGGTSPGALYEALAAGGYTTVNALAGTTDFCDNGSISLDANGNLFVANAINVLEFTPSDGYTTPRTINAIYDNGAYRVGDIAIDPAGNLFGSAGVEFLAVDGVLPASPASLSIGPIVGQAYNLALDGRGNLYFSTDFGLKQLQLSAPPTVDFAQSFVGKTSSDSPRSVEIQNEGTAPLDLSGLSLDNPNWTLVKGSGTPEDCTASTTLATSALCNISLSFKPTEGGPLTGEIGFVDNSLNAPSTQQAIQLEGFGDTFTPPHLAHLSTYYGAPYSVVYVNGANFSTNKGSNKVTFNGIAAPVYYSTSTFLLATVPANATTGNIVVSVGGEVSNAINFTVLPMPMVTGISPASGPVGTVVTIHGNNLFDYYINPKVDFNGKSLPILGDSTTAIYVAVPAGAVTGDFHLVINDTGMTTPNFTVTK